MNKRELTESVTIENNNVIIKLMSNDGLSFAEGVMSVEDENPKAFMQRLEEARGRLVKRRVWLNARKALTVEQIKALWQMENNETIVEDTVLPS